MDARAARGHVKPASTGLTSIEAARRLEQTGPNALPEAEPERPWARVVRSVRDPLVLLLLVAAAVAGIGLREVADAIAIGTIVAINTVIGVVEEGRATRALDALRAMEAPVARVIRDGRTRRIAARDLVPGDLVALEAGDRVPADVEAVEPATLQVDESILTGESLPVDRVHGDTLHAGTYVSRGSSAGIVTATGAATAFGRIAEHLGDERPATPLQRELGRVAARLGIAAVVIAIGVAGLVVARTGASLDALEQALLVGVALAVAAVPEGLATVVTIALALGVRRMANEGAIIRRLPAVETLGATTVIATDKTGTLTENTMRLTDVSVAGAASHPPEGISRAIRERIARAAVLCNDATGEPPTGDPVDLVLLAVAPAGERAAIVAAHPRLDAVPFDSGRRRMTTLHRDLLAVKGAPETVLELCGRLLDEQGERPLAPADTERILARAGSMATEGMRVLAIADRPGARTLQDEYDLTLLALVGLRDPIRPEAPGAVDDARRAGVRVVMVTGDHPGTARAIAERIGIEPDDVHARVGPEGKLELVRDLQAHDEVVAVTGDGVNDAPALRNADIGVAMGRTGSDVAREAGDMVITDDNLATIVTAIRQGRGIFDNLRKVIDYLVAGNLAEIMVVVTVLLAFPALDLPLTPIQLLWINLVTDGLPALALGADAIDPSLMRAPPRARTFRLLSAPRIGLLASRGAVIASAAVAGLVIARYAWEWSWVDARGFMFTVLVVTHLLYAFVVRRAGGGIRGAAALAAAVGIGLALHAGLVSFEPARTLFDATALTLAEWGAVAALGSACIAVLVTWERMRARTASRAPDSARGPAPRG